MTVRNIERMNRVKIKDLTLAQAVEICKKAEPSGTCRACPLSYFFGECMFNAYNSIDLAWNQDMFEKEIEDESD